MTQIYSFKAFFLNILQIRVGDAQVNTAGAVGLISSGPHVPEGVRVNVGETGQEVDRERVQLQGAGELQAQQRVAVHHEGPQPGEVHRAQHPGDAREQVVGDVQNLQFCDRTRYIQR